MPHRDSRQPPERGLRRPGVARVWSAIAIIAASLASCASTDSDTDTANNAAGPNATIERVVDGDTIIADISGTRERIRLIGIDTPESVDPRRPVECFGDEAKDYLTDLLPPGEPIRLELDEEPRDQYDRLLAYVRRTDGDLFLNLELLATGHATTLNIAPNDAYRDIFASAQSDARRANRGLWAACPTPG